MKLNLGLIASFASLYSGVNSWSATAQDYEVKSKADLKEYAQYFLINKQFNQAMTSWGHGGWSHGLRPKRLPNHHIVQQQLWSLKKGPYPDTWYIYNGHPERKDVKLGLHPGTNDARNAPLYPGRRVAARVYQTYDAMGPSNAELWYIEELPAENGVARFAFRNYHHQYIFLGQHRGTNFGRDNKYPDVHGQINPTSLKNAWRYNWENTQGYAMSFPNGKDQLDRNLIWEFQPRFQAVQSIERVWSNDNRQETCMHCETTEVTFSSESFSSVATSMDYSVEASISASYGAVSGSITASFGQSWESAKSYTESRSTMENIRYCAQPGTNKYVFQIKTSFTDTAGSSSFLIKSGPMTLTCCNCNLLWMSDQQKLDWLESSSAEICYHGPVVECPDN